MMSFRSPRSKWSSCLATANSEGDHESQEEGPTWRPDRLSTFAGAETRTSAFVAQTPGQKKQGVRTKCPVLPACLHYKKLVLTAFLSFEHA